MKKTLHITLMLAAVFLVVFTVTTVAFANTSTGKMEAQDQVVAITGTTYSVPTATIIVMTNETKAALVEMKKMAQAVTSSSQANDQKMITAAKYDAAEMTVMKTNASFHVQRAIYTGAKFKTSISTNMAVCSLTGAGVMTHLRV